MLNNADDVVVWPYGYSLRRGGSEVLILNGKGKVVAKVGDRVRMGGGETSRGQTGLSPKENRRAFEKEWPRASTLVPVSDQLWVALSKR